LYFEWFDYIFFFEKGLFQESFRGRSYFINEFNMIKMLEIKRAYTYTELILRELEWNRKYTKNN
jgi:hypothetical protein